MTEITPEMIEEHQAKINAKWTALRKAIWRVVVSSELNSTKYVNAWELTDKLHDAITAALAAAPAPQPVAEPAVVDGVAKALAFAGRTEHDMSANAEEFWEYTGEDNRARYRCMAEAAIAYSAPPAEIDRLKEENKRLQSTLAKIDNIRNSIIGLQTMNWSEHIYPLVAALEEAGISGMKYPEAREKFGTMLERTAAAEARIAELEASEKRMREALEWYGEQARLARLITSEGDAGRNAISADGGTRAHAALAKEGDA